MINWGLILGKIVSAIMSWLDATNLRTRVYELEDEREIMLTALDDIVRMDPHGLVGKLAKNTLSKVDPKFPK